MNRRGGRAHAAFWAETSLGWLIRGCAARRRSAFDSVLVATAPMTALLVGWSAAARLHAALGDAPLAQSALSVACCAVLATEITAAAFIAAARATLCLARDLGRQRCGVLLALATMAACTSTAAIALSGSNQAGLLAALTTCLAMAALRWRFARLYLSDGSPHSRDFDADVLHLHLLMSRRPLAQGGDHEA